MGEGSRAQCSSRRGTAHYWSSIQRFSRACTENLVKDSISSGADGRSPSINLGLVAVSTQWLPSGTAQVRLHDT
ncbi:hypothetical protein VM1G_11410 [Cytospora mali]|uniref:Uncharacterized protein n=1 Tax=Cytospora mali TaxID=578113 RepID=A0A194VQC7_CYTMA|nr:hypothetical protein VM1G_11410 [Valsa mali]